MPDLESSKSVARLVAEEVVVAVQAECTKWLKREMEKNVIELDNLYEGAIK